MSFEGTYEQLRDFLRRTYDLAQLVTVNSVTYREVAEEGTTLAEVEKLLQVEIEAEVYFQPEEMPAGPAPAAPAPPETTTGETTGAP